MYGGAINAITDRLLVCGSDPVPAVLPAEFTHTQTSRYINNNKAPGSDGLNTELINAINEDSEVRTQLTFLKQIELLQGHIIDCSDAPIEEGSEGGTDCDGDGGRQDHEQKHPGSGPACRSNEIALPRAHTHAHNHCGCIHMYALSQVCVLSTFTDLSTCVTLIYNCLYNVAPTYL